MAPSKKGIAFTTQGQDIDEDSNNSWNDDDRHESRSIRIRNRIPTGHPQMAQKVLKQLEDDDDSGQSSREVVKKHKKDKSSSSSKKKSSSKEASSSARGDIKERESKDRESSSSKKKKSSSRKKVTSSDEDTSEEIVVRKKSHAHKKKKVVMSDSDSSVAREVKPKHKSHKKKREILSSQSDDDMGSEDEVVVHKSSRKKKTPEEVKLGRATVVEGGDSEWDEEERKQERFNRIRKRVPTGHPGLAKKILTLQKQYAGTESSDMEETEATPPKTKKSSSKSSKKTGSSGTKKKHKSETIHFGEAKKVDSDSSGSWEEEHRKEERYTRIRSRVPTGHPGLAKKILAAQAEMDEEGDD